MISVTKQKKKKTKNKNQRATVSESTIGKQWYFNDIGE